MTQPAAKATKPAAAEIPPSLDSRIGYHLVRTAMKVRKGYVDALATCDLLPNHHAILAVLNEHGPMYQKILAHRTTVDSGDLVGYLDTLQDSKYVTRERDPKDRRRHLVSITPAGRRKLATADRRLSAAEDKLFSGMTEKKRKDLVTALTEIYDRTEPELIDL